MVGMGAVVAAATHAPLTAMIIIFEMTGDYKIIPPLMAACVLASVLAMRLKQASIYTEKLLRRGVDLRQPLEINVLRKFPISHVLIREPVTVPEETPFRKLVDLVVNSPRSEFFVVRNGRDYVGTISIHQMRRFLMDGDWLDPLIIARDMADRGYPTLGPEDNLDLAMKLFSKENMEELPVVSEGKLVGSVRKSDVLDVYNREVLKRDLSGGFQGALAWVQRAKTVDLGEGYVLAEMEAPPHFAGKTLRELNLRANYGVEVILIREPRRVGKEGTKVPNPDHRIEPGQVMLVAGRPEDVQALSR
jgi:CIC family chloride channel protein